MFVAKSTTMVKKEIDMQVRKQKSNREQPPAGTHLARFVGLSNLGHQPGFQWQGKSIESQYKFELTYELVTCDMSDGRPFWVSEEVNNTDNEEGTLTSRCNAAGVSIDNLVELIDKPVMVTLVMKESGYPKVKNVSGIPEGLPVPELRNPVQLFDIYADPPNLEAFEKFPEFKQNKIVEALDFKTTALYRELLKQGEDTDEF